MAYNRVYLLESERGKATVRLAEEFVEEIPGGRGFGLQIREDMAVLRMDSSPFWIYVSLDGCSIRCLQLTHRRRGFHNSENAAKL